VSPEPLGERAKDEGLGGRERRLSRRFACEGFAEAFAADTGYLFRGEIRDISETGCYIMSKGRLKLERFTEVDLQFMLNKRKYRTFARVMDVRPGKGVGVEFRFADQWAEKQFKELLHALMRTISPNEV